MGASTGWRQVRISTRHGVMGVLGRLLACGVLLILPSCGIPPLRRAEPGPALPAGFGGLSWSGTAGQTTTSGATSQENVADLAISQFYNDPLLVGLIEQALRGNRELRMLNEEVEIARNEVLARRGAYLPFVTAGGEAGLEKSSSFTPLGATEEQLLTPRGTRFPVPVPNFLGSLNLFWQIDIWRELRNARDAAQQRYLAALEQRNGFVTRLVAEVAENYYALMALDLRLRNLTQIIELQENSYQIVRAEMEAGRGTELAVQRFLAEVRKNQSELLIVRQELIQVENQINFLVNRYPQYVERPMLDYQTFFDLDGGALSLGIPAQLLQNRPDIRQAERELAAAGLEVRVARAHFFPRLDLSAGVGYEAFNPRFLFTPEALVYGVAGELVGPVINKAAIRAEYRSANAAQLQVVYKYQRTVLNAFTEVVNLMAKVQNYSQSIERKKQRVAALEAAVDAASKLFQAGRVEYLEVLLAQRDLQEARAELIETKREQLSAIVNTYKALGGGWRSYPAMIRGRQGLPAVQAVGAPEPILPPADQPLPPPPNPAPDQP
jgi:NodT family efflux transporter outer membrane factor (OMF) lipoprotein